MNDVTYKLEGSNVGLKASGSKLTRLDLLKNQLENIKERLNLEKEIKTIVYENEELVESVKGSIKDTEEIVEYYSDNFVLAIKCRANRNEIIIRLVKPIMKSADSEIEKTRTKE